MESRFYGYGYCEIPPLRVTYKDPESTIYTATAIGVFSVPGKILSFRILLDNGAMISKVPITALSTIDNKPELEPREAQIWDCLSYGISCVTLNHVNNTTVTCLTPAGQKIKGNYLFTLIPWGKDTYAERAGELGYKDFHIISTRFGLLAYPNTDISWNEKSCGINGFDWDNPPVILPPEELPSVE